MIFLFHHGAVNKQQIITTGRERQHHQYFSLGGGRVKNEFHDGTVHVCFTTRGDGTFFFDETERSIYAKRTRSSETRRPRPQERLPCQLELFFLPTVRTFYGGGDAVCWLVLWLCCFFCCSAEQVVAGVSVVVRVGRDGAGWSATSMRYAPTITDAVVIRIVSDPRLEY